MRMYKKTYKKTTKRRPAAKPKNLSPLEKDEQMLLFDWAEFAMCQYPELELMYHIVNEGKRSVYEGSKLISQGMKRGVPDICLPVPRGGYGALYIELKRRQGGRVSKDQRDWVDALNRVGNRALVCKGFDEAKKAIEDYLNGK